MPNSVLDAIKLGIWDFEPQGRERREYDSTDSMPGTNEKLAILAERLEQGLPLWHPSDRRTFSDGESEI